jgi:hypothetical protein
MSSLIDDFVAAVRSVQGERGNKFVSCQEVLRIVALQRDIPQATIERCLSDLDLVWPPEMVILYERFLGIVRDRKWIEGQGNFGTNEYVAAHPSLLQCRLVISNDRHGKRSRPE